MLGGAGMRWLLNILEDVSMILVAGLECRRAERIRAVEEGKRFVGAAK